jgi:hypothetical protein
VTKEVQRRVKSWRLIPESSAKVFPNFIPRPILDDYNEACAIRERSPKASATLSRRCLQGMLRDFWDVKVPSRKLIHEIEAIKDKVEPEVWKARSEPETVGWLDWRRPAGE